MDQLVEKLITLGLSKTDAQVYISLLKNGRAGGYKIAKDLSLSRSSVYQSLDNLYLNGFIFMMEGSSKEYEAKAPEVLLSQLQKKTLENIATLKTELTKLPDSGHKPFIYNLTGYENLLLQVKEIINESHEEIYLNTDFYLALFSQELQQAVSRGVRIICFSFNRLVAPCDGLDIFYRIDLTETEYPSRRFMIVSDNQKALIFSNADAARGIYTNEQLLVRITSEHIHNDIYLSSADLDFSKIQLLTTHESNDFKSDRHQS